MKKNYSSPAVTGNNDTGMFLLTSIGSVMVAGACAGSYWENDG